LEATLLEFGGGVLGGGLVGAGTFTVGAYTWGQGLTGHGEADHVAGLWLQWLGYIPVPLGCALGNYITGRLLNRGGKFGAALGGSYLGAVIQLPLFLLNSFYPAPFFYIPSEVGFASFVFSVFSVIPSTGGTLFYERSRPHLTPPHMGYNPESVFKFTLVNIKW
jgi:hypothetical protein